MTKKGSTQELRESLGINQFAFAATLGVAVSTVYRWEDLPKRWSPDPRARDILQKLDLVDRRHFKRLGKMIERSLLANGDYGNLAAMNTLIGFILKSRRS